ncbi:MAG: hypothetical protein CMB80_25820 [Flammeovirgaceae bacterium]|nr:hypothetical protein [Flammeovirgaceae bacterium]
MLLSIIWILVAYLFANATYSSVNSIAFGQLGLLSEDLSMASYAFSLGMVITMPLLLRFKMRFKSYQILYVTALGLMAINALCMITVNPTFLIILNFFAGGLKLMGLIEAVLPIMFMISPTMNRSIFYPIFYPITIVLGQGSAWLSAWLAHHYSWVMIYPTVMIMLAVVLLIALFIYHKEPMNRKFPLYQVDWLSFLLLGLGSTLFIYFMVYGKTLNWFESDLLTGIAFVIPGLLVWFVLRQINKKRPFITLSVFKMKSVLMSLPFMACMVVLMSTSKIEGAYSAVFLNLSTYDIVSLSLWMFPGVLIGGIGSLWWFKKKLGFKGILIIGFGSFTAAHLMNYFLFAPESEVYMFYLPMFFKGLGMIILYVALSILISQRLEMTGMISALTYLLIVRTAIGPVLFASLNDAWFTNQRQESYVSAISHIDATDPDYQAQVSRIYRGARYMGNNAEDAMTMAVGSQFGKWSKQAILSSAKTMAGYMTMFGIFVMFMVLISRNFPVNKRRLVRLRQKFRNEQAIDDAATIPIPV